MMFTRLAVLLVLFTINLTIHAEKTVSPRLAESIAIISGSGHGGSLTIMTFQKVGADQYAVLEIYFDSGSMMNRPKPQSAWPWDSYRMLRMRKAPIKSDTFDKAKEIAKRGLQQAVFVEYEGKHARSSNDFICGLTLTIDGKNSQKIWCGYSDTSKQTFYKPLGKACRDLEKLVEGCNWQEGATPELAQFATATLISLYPKFKDSSWWWPKERLIRMVGVKDNPKAIPILIKLLRETKDQVYSKTDSVVERNLGYITSSLDNITGLKLRFDDQGKPRPLDDVVSDYLKRYKTTK